MKSLKRDFRSWLEIQKPKLLASPHNAIARGKLLCSQSEPFLTEPSPDNMRWCGHVMANRKQWADFFGVDDLSHALIRAMDNPVTPQDVPWPYVEERPLEINQLGPFSLPKLPLTNYFTSFIVAAPVANGDVNLSIHRAQVREDGSLVLRVVRRHLYELLEQAGGRLRAALLTGVSPAILLASAVSLPSPGGELNVAGALQNMPVEIAEIDGLRVPISFEICITGEFTGEMAPEGPFIDLTGTLDPVREQPVFRMERILTRPNPILPMILPSSPEHALLMGFPRETGILRALSPLYHDSLRVRLTAGAVGWLHAVVSGTSRATKEEIARVVFATHPSCKRLTLVDADIDPDNPHEVEWALATRFQPGRDVLIFPNERGSTLDPSSRDGITDRWVLDARIPLASDPQRFVRLLKL